MVLAVQISHVFVTSHFILCTCTNSSNEISYMLIVYRAPHLADRPSVWNDIPSIISEYPNILLIGDYNQIEYLDNKLGDSLHIPGSVDFIHCRLENVLMDSPFCAPPFDHLTNNHHDNSVSFERLDKAYASHVLFNLHPYASASHQPILLSDHVVIILNSDSISRVLSLTAWIIGVFELNQWLFPPGINISYVPLCFPCYQRWLK